MGGNSTSPSVKLSLLGTFALTVDGEPFTQFRTNKVRALLAYLVTEADRPHRRDVLATLLWPTLPQQSARANLRHALDHLRQNLEQAKPGLSEALLDVTRSRVTVRLDPLWCDVVALDALTSASQRHHHPEEDRWTCETCQGYLSQAIDLYQGGFLVGFSLPDSEPFEEWVTITREQLRRQAESTLETLIEMHLRRRDYESVERCARRLLELNPWHELVHRQLMRSLALSGRRNIALKQYQICRQLLEREFGEGPAAETIGLHEQIQSGALGWEAAKEDTSSPPNPYKGLQPFQEDDARDFFGREALVGKLLERLEARPEGEEWTGRFLAVVGPSGSGKSSLIRAGLIPALRRAAQEGGKHWRVATMFPGTNPQSELYAVLDEVLPDEVLTLADFPLSRVGKDSDSKRLLLFIDQAEELFTLTEEEARTRFIAHLLSAIQAPESCLRVMVALRADYYARPLRSPDWGRLFTRRVEFTLPLSPDELRRAIEEPARRVGVSLEPALVSTLVADAGRELGALPLLQYTLTELFERGIVGGWHERRLMTLADYQAIGGLTGALVGRVDELYAGLSDLEQAAVRQMFLRLVVLDEGAQAARRRVSRAELFSLVERPWGMEAFSSDTQRQAMETVLDLFGQRRLLTFDQDPVSGEPTVEIAHEALIVAWDRLRGWIRAARDELRLRRRLGALAREWERSGREPSFLARGQQLDQFEDWAAADLAMTGVESAYLRASLAERGVQQMKEAEQWAREAALERRSRSRLRALAAVLTLATVVALALSGFALNQQRAARREAALAQSLNLSTSAQLALTRHNTDLALALALAANQIPDPPPQARLMLADAAYAPGTRRLFEGHTGPVEGLAISADGQTAISASADETLILWNLETGEAIRRFTGHRDVVHAVALHPDGDWALSASADGTLILWDISAGLNAGMESGDGSGTPAPSVYGGAARHFTGHTGEVWCVAIAPDGRTALSGSADHTLILWDLETGEAIRRFSGHEDAVLSVAISPDGERALSGSDDRSVILWDLNSGRMIHRFVGQTDTLEATTYDPQGHFGAVWGVAFSPDCGNPLAAGCLGISASYDEHTMIWDLASGKRIGDLSPIELEGSLFSLAVSPDGRTALLGTLDNTVGLLDLTEGESVLQLLGHTGRVQAVAFTPDGRHALSGSADGTLRLWDLQSGVERRRVYGTLLGPGIDISPDGRTGLAAAWDGKIWLWDYGSGKMLRSLEGHTEMVFAGAYFTPDGKRIVSGAGDIFGVSEDNSVRLWDVATGEEIHRFEGHTDKVWDVAVSPDGRYAASGSHDGTLRLWDLMMGKGRILADFSPQAVRSVAFNPSVNEEMILFGLAKGSSNTPDYSLRLIDVTTSEELRRFEGHEEVVADIAFSPDGRLALSGSVDQRVILWDTVTGRPIHYLTGHSASSQAVAFSPDGKLAVSAGADQTIFIWDVATGTLLRRFIGHTEYVLELVFTPDGNLLSVCDDDTVREWEVDASQEGLLTWIRANRYTPELTCEQRAQYHVEPLCE